MAECPQDQRHLVTFIERTTKILEQPAGIWQVDKAMQNPGIKTIIARPVGGGDNSGDQPLLIALGCTFHAKLVFAGDEGVGEFSSPLRQGIHTHPLTLGIR